MRIAEYCDQVARFLIDPVNKKNGHPELAIAITIITGVVTLGLAQGACALWRQFHPVSDKNETLRAISAIFTHTVKAKPQKENLTKTEASEPDQTPPKPITDEQLRTLNALVSPPKGTKPLGLFLESFSRKHKKILQISVQRQGKVERLRIWRDQKGLLNLQLGDHFLASRRDRLSLACDASGKITAVYINGRLQKDLRIPSRFQGLIQTSLRKSLENSSRYTVRTEYGGRQVLGIKVIKGGLKEIPTFHLQKLTELFDRVGGKLLKVRLSVDFLTADLERGAGQDATGLTREYLDDLMAGLIQSPELNFISIQENGEFLPSTLNVPPKGQLPQLKAREKVLYQRLGQVLMCCYLSHPLKLKDRGLLISGRHFDNALFQGVLCLTKEEINTPFKNLSQKTLLKMCEALKNARSEAGENLSRYDAPLAFLKTVESTDKELLEIAAYAEVSGCLADQFLTAEEVDLAKIKANLILFRSNIADSLFAPEGVSAPFGRQLAPIHAIAQGMALRSIVGWDKQKEQVSYLKMSAKIQGEISRSEILKAIVLDNSAKNDVEINKKTQWLKSWLGDEENGASEEELRLFVKFVTGTTSLAGPLTISSKGPGPTTPFPIAHTCFSRLDLAPQDSSYGHDYNDHTEENFVGCLKELLHSSDAFSYSLT